MSGTSEAAKGRVLGVDLGSRRVGIAVSDSAGSMAMPYEVVQRSASGHAEDHRRLAELVEETGAALVVIGLPLSLDGSVGAAAAAALAEAEELRGVVRVPVETFDERLTTVSADRSLVGQRMKADARRRVVDKVAAAVMLQAWLDARRRS